MFHTTQINFYLIAVLFLLEGKMEYIMCDPKVLVLVFSTVAKNSENQNRRKEDCYSGP